LWRLRRPAWRPGLPTHVRLLSFSRCGACGEVGVRTLSICRLAEPNAQGGTPPCGVCGARAGAQACPRTYVCYHFRGVARRGGDAEVWLACGAQRPRRYTSLWRLRRPGGRPGVPTHVRLLSFSRFGASGWGRGGLVGLWSPTPKEVHLLVALVAPGLAPKLAHACATVVAFALWRLWRGVRCFRRLEEPSAQEHIPSCGVVAPRLTAKRAHVRAAVVVFASWRLWRG